MRRILESESMDSPEKVLAYERIVAGLGFWMEDPVVRILSRLIKRRDIADCRILDIGGGTARISIKVALKTAICKIYVADTSSNMLEVARKNIENKMLQNRIILLKADGKNLSFENNFFNAVISSNMLHHIKDPLEILREIRRVASKDAIIVIRDLIRPPSKFILNLMVQTVGAFHNRLMKKEYRDSLYASFTIKECKEIIKSSGIEGLKIKRSLIDYLSGHVSLIKEN